ncbi:MAG: hypothetical protein HYY46_17735 [Deltaproteobacteria bacterium]|nr:hypothetical protein [Deltaproteobacteria bacterium]
MKTTIDIPAKMLRRAEGLAAAKGITLKQLLTEAIEDKLRLGVSPSGAHGSPWMRLYRAFAKSEEMRAETRRIQKLMEEEFERINPKDWE